MNDNDQNQNNQGAPSSDNTSALFVSARKKQLAEQEEQRVAAEKEAARKAAEDEVRRLEEEVEERKKKAQEDAVRIQQEEAEQRKQAEITKAKIAADAKAGVVGNQFGTATVAKGTTATVTAPVAPSGPSPLDRILADKKLLAIIGGAVGGVIIFIIVLSLIFGGSGPRFVHNLDDTYYIVLNDDGSASGYAPTDTSFSGTWVTDGVDILVESDDYTAYLGIIDENTIYDYNFQGEFVLQE